MSEIEKKVNGFCYTLSHQFLDLKFYYGSTECIDKRWREHIYACNNPNSKRYNVQVYKYIREHGGINNWKIDIIYEGEDYETFESEIIEDTFDENINSIIPYRDGNGFKERKKAYSKKHNDKNKEQIRVSRKKYREKNKEQISAKGKDYYEKNKDEIKAKNKERYEKNKDEINTKAKGKNNL